MWPAYPLIQSRMTVVCAGRAMLPEAWEGQPLSCWLGVGGAGLWRPCPVWFWRSNVGE